LTYSSSHNVQKLVILINQDQYCTMFIILYCMFSSFIAVIKMVVIEESKTCRRKMFS